MAPLYPVPSPTNTKKWLLLIWIVTSSICEWRMVDTALMIESTLGFEIVVPMYMELSVDDLRYSSSSRSRAAGTTKGTFESTMN